MKFDEPIDDEKFLLYAMKSYTHKRQAYPPTCVCAVNRGAFRHCDNQQQDNNGHGDNGKPPEIVIRYFMNAIQNSKAQYKV